MTKNIKFQGLRGYAITLIFLSHAGVAGRYAGALGVEIFILLSGYLLMSCHSNNVLNLKMYFVRKFRKFYPLHFLQCF